MSAQLNESKNQKIYFIVNRNIPEEIFGPVTGIYKEHIQGGIISAVLVEADELGLWLENSKIELQDVKTSKIATHRGYVLIKWEYIVSIIRMPDKETTNIKNELGFKY